ncbi:MAG: hypothetical protein GXP49_18930, partial [Deltaproteobacteria bacterium]|nr:hypothetical protein [Deltaproteobacteria bacterium]
DTDTDTYCNSSEDCPSGEACMTVTGECGPCRTASECRPGEACADGVCGACISAGECDGGLCDSGACRKCVPGDDDEACGVQYNDVGYKCWDDGLCGPDQCTGGEDCWKTHKVCSADSRCVPCEKTDDCLDQEKGNYPARTTCIQGLCVEGDCEDSVDCNDDKPICGEDFRCRGCQKDQECLDLENVDKGYYCVTLTGRCTEGDCSPPGGLCGESKDRICGVDYYCADCTEDIECRVAMSVENGICKSGKCALGCDKAVDCQASGKVCGQDHRCTGCTGNAECYNTDYLCIGGSCIKAECNDEKPCTQGQVCDGQLNICRNCRTHEECGEGKVCDLGDTKRCYEGECTVSTQDDLCSTNLCDPSKNTCMSCTDKSDCGQGRVCDNGDCVTGECTDADQDTDCPSTRLCKDHNCIACYALNECGAGRICDTATHACLTGNCLGREHCGVMEGTQAGQICDSLTHTCVACANDPECITAGYPAGTICDNGLCQQGCSINAECASNWCAGGRCKNCEQDSNCGTGRVCNEDTGVCVEGTCAVDADCVPTEACKVGSCIENNGNHSCSYDNADDHTVCDDGDPCSSKSECQGGFCVGIEAKCDDGLSCSVDNCNPSNGECSHTQAGASECYVEVGGEGQCVPDGGHPQGQCSTCVSGTIQAGCDDGVGCTVDSCNASTNSCVNTPNNALCDDNSICTTDVCSAASGCSHTATNEGADCDDHNSSTYGSLCVSGACRGRWSEISKCVYVSGSGWLSCIRDYKTGFRWIFDSCNRDRILFADTKLQCKNIGFGWVVPSNKDYQDLGTSQRHNDCDKLHPRNIYVDPAFKMIRAASSLDPVGYWSVSTCGKDHCVCGFVDSPSTPVTCTGAPASSSFTFACVRK